MAAASRSGAKDRIGLGSRASVADGGEGGRRLRQSMYQASAGLIAGSVTSLLMSPFDVARTRMQIQHVCGLPPHLKAGNAFQAFALIAKHEGWRGFFRGYSAAGVAIPLFWATYFPVYSFSKRMMAGVPGVPQPLMHAASAIFTAVICDTITSPLWVIRTRLQTQALHLAAQRALPEASQLEGRAVEPRYRGLLQTLTLIREREGLPALYKGLVASWLGASHVAIQFPLYEYLRGIMVDVEARALQQQQAVSNQSTELTAALSLIVADALDPSSAVADLDSLLDVPSPGPAVSSACPFSGGAAEIGAGTGGSAGATGVAGNAQSVASLAKSRPSTLGLVAASVVSKLVASVATYPHETIRARLQDQRDHVSRRYAGVVDCATQTYNAEGLAGLYCGFTVNLMRALPAVATTFFVYGAAHCAIVRACEAESDAEPPSGRRRALL